jgi:formylmethanofuran dehydrogenase subunit B
MDRVVIVETRNVCARGSAWFRSDRRTSEATINERPVTLEQAVAAAVALLQSAKWPLISVGQGLSCEEQRMCVAIADLLRARLDSTTARTSLSHLLATQERGFASATFGEIRNRADLMIYWAIDAANRYPRLVPRYAPASATSIAVDVGAATATVDAHHRFTIAPSDELTTLIALTAPATAGIGAIFNEKRYIALVYDAEPDDRASRSAGRFDALIALSHALNDRARCATIAMRGSGNVSGADSVLTSATGYPTSVDFARGYPRYRPYGASEPDVVLVVGDRSEGVVNVAGAQTISIGPNATLVALGSTAVAIDAGAAGIHTAGTAVRADDVPLPLRPSLHAPRSVGDVLSAIMAGIR